MKEIREHNQLNKSSHLEHYQGNIALKANGSNITDLLVFVTLSSILYQPQRNEGRQGYRRAPSS